MIKAMPAKSSNTDWSLAFASSVVGSVASTHERPTIPRATKHIKIPIENKEILEDVVQGTVEVNKSEIDDYVLVRRDGTPTYMLSVVVDDHDLGVNFIIRGDDHLNNYFRQKFIYEYMNWEIPRYAHIPLIHGEDGSKLSKRHGAVN